MFVVWYVVGLCVELCCCLVVVVLCFCCLDVDDCDVDVVGLGGW